MHRRNPGWRRRYFRFFGPQVEREVDDEIAFHLEQLEQDLRARGLTPLEASSLANQRFGDVRRLRQQLKRIEARRVRRSSRREAFMNFMRDIGLTVRRQRSAPGFTVTVVGLLALGIGASITIFSALDAALLRPLPFTQPDRLVTLRNIRVPFQASPTAPPEPRELPDFGEVSAMRDQFTAVAMYAAGGLNLADAERPVRVQAGVVTAGFFETLGIAPLLGRTFSKVEGEPRGHSTVILSHALWQRQFGGAAVLGRPIRLGKKSYTVIGVMPRAFSFPNESDLWVPFTVPATFDTFEAFRGYLPTETIARLAPGVSLAQARARLTALWEQHVNAAAEPGKPDYREEALREIHSAGALTPMQRTLAGDRRTTLLILFGATSLLLLIACANVTNLLLARASLRRRELAVLTALGASRGRITRLVLTESTLLAVMGATLGLALAPLALGAVSALMPEDLVGLAPLQIDVRVVAFALGIALLTGIGCGIWPVAKAADVNPIEAIKAGSGWGMTGGQSRGRRVLVAIELALTLPLLIGSGLMFQSLARVVATDPGLDLDRVAALELAFSGDKGTAHRMTVVAGALQRLRTIPGVEAAGIVNEVPLGGSGGIALQIEAEGTDVKRDEPIFPRYLTASDGYFRALRIPLLRGRLFNPGDDSLGTRVAVINQHLARQLWGDVDPIGRRFKFSTNPDRREPYSVVGLVGDVRHTGLELDPPPQMFMSAYAGVPFNLALVARGTMSREALVAHLRGAVRTVDASQPVIRVRMMDEVVGSSVASRRANTILITVFGGLGLLIAALGVYGVVAYGVAQRHREIGIRGALGARGRELVALLFREMLAAAAGGVAIGLGVAWTLGRIVESQLFGVTARDGRTFMGAVIVLLFAAMIATLVPALRTLRIDPAEAMRVE